MTPSPAASPTRSPARGPSRPELSWRQIVALGWSVAAALACTVLGVRQIRFRLRLRDRRPLTHPELVVRARRLATRLELRRPIQVSVSERLPVPFAHGWLRREICLPQRLVDDLSIDEQEAVLAHEMAHHERRDPLWQAMARWTAALLFFQPLNRRACRELAQRAELSCDGRAAEITGHPMALASSLTTIARWSLGSPLPVGTALADPPKADLRSRVHRLADGRATRLPSSGWGAALGLALAGAVLVLTPALANPKASPSLPGARIVKIPAFATSASKSAEAGEAQSRRQPAPPTPSEKSPQPEAAKALEIERVPAPSPPLPARATTPVATPKPAVAPRPAAAPTSPTAASSPVAPAEENEVSPEIEFEIEAEVETETETTVEVEVEAPEVDAELSEEEQEALEEELEQAFEEFERVIETEVEAAMEALEETLERDMEGIEELIEGQMEILEVELERSMELLEKQLEAKAMRLEKMEAGAERDQLEAEVHELAEAMGDLGGIIGSRVGGADIWSEISHIAEPISRIATSISSQHEELAVEMSRLMERYAVDRQRPSPEEIEEFRRRAREMAGEIRPKAEELEALREDIAAQMAPMAERLERLREELRTDVEQWKIENAELLKGLEATP